MIAMYGDTQEQVLDDMLKAIKWLTAVGFMLNLHEPVGLGSCVYSQASLDIGWILC